MECDQCGARRPRSGPCPECGAPPPGTYSSMRQWKDQTRTGQGPAVGRGSGTNWGGNGGNGGNASSGRMRNPRQPSNGWDEGGYEDAPPMRSSGRNRRGAPNYNEVDLEQALVPAQNNMLAMDPGAMSMGAGLPALPGLPQTDEEERAIGIRRPVYIPAVNEKRKKKLGTWRVVSGVLSVMLFCIAGCGAGAFFGHNQIASILGRPLQIVTTVQPYSTANVPITPVATPGPQSKYVSNCITAQGHSAANFTPIGETSHFKTNQSVNVLCLASNFPKGQHTITVHWFSDNVFLQLPANAQTTLQISSSQEIAFQLSYPSPALGTAKIFFDLPGSDDGSQANDPYLAATIYFAIDAPGVNTVPPGTPTVSPAPSATSTTKPKK